MSIATPQDLPAGFIRSWCKGMQLMLAIVQEQAATLPALIREPCSSNKNTPNLHGGCLRVCAASRHVINHSVDAIANRKPLLVWNEMSLLRQAVCLISDGRSAIATDFHGTVS